MTIINCIKVKELSLFLEFFLAIALLYIILSNLLLLRLKNVRYFLTQNSNLNLSYLVFFLSLFLIFNNDSRFLSYSSFYFTVNSSYLSFLAKLFVILLSLLFLTIIRNELEFQKINKFEYLVLFLFSKLSLLFLITAGDLLLAYLSIELQSLAFYILTGFTRKSNYSIASGLKYFVLSSLTSAFFLFGCSFIYGILGTLNFQELQILCVLKVFNGCYTNLLQFSLLFILLALFFKLVAAPFHFWAPVVYNGAPTISVIFFSVMPKISVFILMLKLYYYSFYYLFDFWKFYIVLASMLSVFVGSIGGLEQRKLKALLIYSGINHIGYLLFLLSAGAFNGIQALFIYLFIYKISSICTWLVVLLSKSKTNKGQKQSRDLSNLVLLRKSNLTLAIIITITLFSIAGLPPLVGFLPKISVFLFAMKFSFYVPVILVAFFSIIATFYYLRIIKVLFFEKVLVGLLYYKINQQEALVLAIFTYFLLFIFTQPTLIYLISYKAVFLTFHV